MSVQRNVATACVAFLAGTHFGSLLTALVTASYRRPAVRGKLRQIVYLDVLTGIIHFVSFLYVYAINYAHISLNVTLTLCIFTLLRSDTQ